MFLICLFPPQERRHGSPLSSNMSLTHLVFVSCVVTCCLALPPVGKTPNAYSVDNLIPGSDEFIEYINTVQSSWVVSFSEECKMIFFFFSSTK